MRQAITLTKKRDGSWSMTSSPDVPYDEQRAAFNRSPDHNSSSNEVAEVKLVKISRETVKTRHYTAPAKVKAAKKKAAN